MFQVTPIVAMSGAALQLQALLGLGRLKDAVGLAEQVLAALSKLGCAGIHEVPARLAVSETLYASGDLTRARVELQETLRQIQLRADDITDPLWKNSYLTRNRSCVRVQSLARDWGLNAVIK